MNGKPVIKIPDELQGASDIPPDNIYIEIGDEATLQKTISIEDITKLAEVTGDRNPLHVDQTIAGKSRFGKQIAQGMLAASIISSVLGTKLPGLGTIYISQTMNFKWPVFIGDTITATVKITKIHETKPIVTLTTNCYNQDGKLLVDGEAVVLVEYII